MENQIFKYYIYDIKKCKEIKRFGNNLTFQFFNKPNTIEFTVSEILGLANNLGKDLLKITNQTDLIKKFICFYEEHGYVNNKSFSFEKDVFVLYYDEIECLASFFGKFHILYQIYSIVTQSSITVEQSKKLIRYFQLLDPNFESTNFSNPKKAYYDFLEIAKPFLDYEMNIKFDVDFDDNRLYTKVISTNICDLCIFIFTNMISSNIIGKKAICKVCGNFYLKTGRKQYYCPNCQKTRNYNKTLDERKLEIINKLEYQYNHYDFSNEISSKLRSFIRLKQNSRARLETNLKDLKNFLENVSNSQRKEKSMINSGYNDYY